MKLPKSLISWCKRNWKIVVAGFTLVTLIFSLYWALEDKIQMLITKKKIEIAKNNKEIAQLESKKEALQNSRKDHQEELKKIDNRLGSIKKDIVKRRAEVDKLTLKQKLDRFNKLGY